MLLLHGFPSGSVPASFIGNDLPELADRVAIEMGWIALAIRFRGCGDSTGDFALSGWVDDARAALAHLRTHDVERIWICGFGTGGTIALLVAAADPDVAGVAVVGTPADFSDWARQPDELLAHARATGVIKGEDWPRDLDGWKSELRTTRATDGAERLGERPLLVLHGSEDEMVPQFDARSIADAHGSADLRIINGAGHQLRHDPRGVSILLGWLERKRNQ